MVLPAPEGPPAGRLAEEVAERVLTRLARQGRFTPPVGSPARASTIGATDPLAADTSEAPTNRLLPAPEASTTRGTGPEPGAQAPIPARDHPDRQPDLRLPEPDLRPRVPETTAVGPPAGTSPGSAAGRRVPPRTPAVPEPPRIRVSIGRVEVRAVHAAPATATSPEPRPQPGPLTSLEEYLKQRESGA